MIDLQLYSVDKTNERNIGAQVPQQIGIYSVASAAQNIVSTNQSVVNQAIAQGLIPAGSSNIVIALALIASGLVQSSLLSSTIGFFRRRPHSNWRHYEPKPRLYSFAYRKRYSSA